MLFALCFLINYAKERALGIINCLLLVLTISRYFYWTEIEEGDGVPLQRKTVLCSQRYYWMGRYCGNVSDI